MEPVRKPVVKDAAYYREKAREARQREEDSFQRSDTDGCVSQWCSGFTAREADARAEILENGGMASFRGLYEGMRRVKAKKITTDFGDCWLLHDSETRLIAARGKRFVPREGYSRKSRVLKKLGLAERSERASAWAKIDAPAGAKGFSGLTSLFIRTYRTGDEWGGDALLEEHLCIQEKV